MRWQRRTGKMAGVTQYTGAPLPARHANGNVIGQICPACGFPLPQHSTGCAHYVPRPPPVPVLPLEPTDPAELRRLVVGIVVMAAILVCSGVGAVVGATLVPPVEPREILGLEFGVQGALAVVALGGALLTFGKTVRQFALPRNLGWFAVAVAGSVATFALAYGTLKLVHLAGVPLILYDQPFKQAGYGFSALFLLLCVMAPFSEELAFRGIAQPALAHFTGGTPAIFITAGAFAVAHLNIVSLPQLFVLGLALGYLRQRSGSVLPGMVLHLSHNLWVAVTQWYPGAFPFITY